MSPADDEMAAKIEPTDRKSPGAATGSEDSDDIGVRIHPSLLDEPVERDDFRPDITSNLDQEALERKVIYDRLAAIENEMKKRGSRGFGRYLIAILIGVAATFAWQSYGESTKQIIATKAPELGWSPEAKQMIASWVKPLAVESKAIPVTQAAPEKVAAKPAAPTLDPQQMQQIKTDIAVVGQTIERHLADVRATVEQLAASQSEMAREIQKLQAANREILEKISAPPPQPPAAPARKPTPVPPSRGPIAAPSSRTPIPPRQ